MTYYDIWKIKPNTTKELKKTPSQNIASDNKRTVWQRSQKSLLKERKWHWGFSCGHLWYFLEEAEGGHREKREVNMLRVNFNNLGLRRGCNKIGFGKNVTCDKCGTHGGNKGAVTGWPNCRGSGIQTGILRKDGQWFQKFSLCVPRTRAMKGVNPT